MYSIHLNLILVRIADDSLHHRMPSLNMVIGSWLILIEIVPVNWWKVSIELGGSEIVYKMPQMSLIVQMPH